MHQVMMQNMGGRKLPNSKLSFANTTSQHLSQLIQENQAVQASVAGGNIEFIWPLDNRQFIMFRIKKTNAIIFGNTDVQTITPAELTEGF
ncbi:hypothetical protein [Vibrio sp. HA2012]|uniref:hypothetical protein n=1 Tax=Vibrio sp. HA2012 TaxID=1971595 RepID=UPI0012FDA291|nr:hypothetical protein [Vibrio sp. HA2012]